MKIIIITLLILGLVFYLGYKIKNKYSKKELYSFLLIVLALIIGAILYNNYDNERMPNAFKAEYLKEKKIEIQKISYSYSAAEVLNSSSKFYNFLYIISKENKEYVCEAKDVEVQRIEDEYLFKKYKEECRIK